MKSIDMRYHKIRQWDIDDKAMTWWRSVQRRIQQIWWQRPCGGEVYNISEFHSGSSKVSVAHSREYRQTATTLITSAQINKIRTPTPSQLQTNMHEHKYKKKARIKWFNEVRQLAYVLRAEGKILFKPRELQGLQIDPKIQIKNLRKLAVKFSQRN